MRDASDKVSRIHRDISVGNIILVQEVDGSPRKGYLIDWETSDKVDENGHGFDRVRTVSNCTPYGASQLAGPTHIGIAGYLEDMRIGDSPHSVHSPSSRSVMLLLEHAGRALKQLMIQLRAPPSMTKPRGGVVSEGGFLLRGPDFD